MNESFSRRTTAKKRKQIITRKLPIRGGIPASGLDRGLIAPQLLISES
jgi:hypothetical protein